MATPHVAGVAALAWAKNPAVSVAAVKNALLNGGDAIRPSAGRRSPAGGSTRTARWRSSRPSGTPELTVVKGGNGGGTVTGMGINCGTDCTESSARGRW